MPEAPSRYADLHRQFAGVFSQRVAGVTDWSAPAPVDGWTARDVVDHLVSWFPGFLAMGSPVTLPAGPSVDQDPVGAWEAQRAGVQTLLDDRDVSSREFSHPRIGTLPLDLTIHRFYTSDVFLHTWDLARATGQDDRLDPDFCAELLAGMEQMEDVIRASGQYGERVPVPEDADVQTRLLGFIGRDPEWRPAGFTG